MSTAVADLGGQGLPINRKALQLDAKAVDAHWQSKGLRRAIQAMEASEAWTVDVSAEVEYALTELSAKLSATPSHVLAKTIASATSDVVALMGYLKTGRAIRMFEWLTQNDPKCAKDLVSEACVCKSDFGVILLERLRILDRQQLLARVFSRERLALVKGILNSMSPPQLPT